MAQDFFGYNRTVGSTDQLSSSEYATLSVGGDVMLCQSVDASYQQEVKPLYEIGNPSIFFVPGHANGTVTFTRLAGEGNFFSTLRNNNCGQITPVSLNSSGGGCFAASGTLSFSGAVIRSVALSLNAQNIEITERAEIMVASMN